MIKKRLKKYTTIPQNLYVNRNADEQLASIIDEMQRPGYVLVSRQMGKTNLLFNAKRQLENEGRLLAYVDLSNTFTYERDCYRNIIDNIVEPNEKLFNNIIVNIENIREKNLPPHKEYSNALRILLKHLKGDMVIILDEIDALKSADYSDNIFAQIRSNYFSRTNYPEFERLTYVLSGVIDPVELIKDRNKSPFNIGEKIYLDDFTKNEHKTFINNSCLNINSEVSDHIYSWTNGNPRLTFDICSEVENFLIDGEKITTDKIDNLIKEKYLTTYDIAPIDHIRELVKSNKKVRNAVLSIQQGKSSELHDEIKKKLYLDGIIDSKFNEKTSIKNRIIKLSLTEEWIKSVDKESKSNLTYALALYDSDEYSKVIEYMTDYLESQNPTEEDKETANFFIGQSYFKLKNYKKSTEYFSKEFINDHYKIKSKVWLGISKLSFGDKEGGIAILEELILTKSNDSAYHTALLNLAINLDESDDRRALQLHKNLYNSTFESESQNESELLKYRTLSLYYQASIHIRKDEINKAVDKITLSLTYSDSSDSLYLKYFKYLLQIDKDESLKSEIVRAIIDQNIRYNNAEAYPISFCEKHLIHFLDLVFDVSNTVLFQELLEHAETELNTTEIEKYILAYLSSNISEKSTDILEYLLGFKAKISHNLLVTIYRDLSFKNQNDFSKFISYFNKYCSEFSKQDNLMLDDLYLFALGIKSNSDTHRIKRALELCETIEKRIQNSDDEQLQFESLIINYWYATIYYERKNRLNAMKYANKTIMLIAGSKDKRTSMIDAKGLKSISEQMENIVKSYTTNQPLVKKIKHGRNDKIKVKYIDGRNVTNKYKRLESDILAERCEVIESL